MLCSWMRLEHSRREAQTAGWGQRHWKCRLRSKVAAVFAVVAGKDREQIDRTRQTANMPRSNQEDRQHLLPYPSPGSSHRLQKPGAGMTVMGVDWMDFFFLCLSSIFEILLHCYSGKPVSDFCVRTAHDSSLYWCFCGIALWEKYWLVIQ